MSDTYTKFSELQANTGIDGMYEVLFCNRGTEYLILTPHGGQIEPGTEVVVRALAGDTLSYYIFLGTNPRQHITSNNYDEPKCLQLVEQVKTVISIHGKKGSEEFVMLGGLDLLLIERIRYALITSGFIVRDTDESVSGLSSYNLCNKGTSGKGVQLELSRGLRDSLRNDEKLMRRFAETIIPSLA